MINSKEIMRAAEGLVKTYGTRDPETIARAMGLQVVTVDTLEKLLGMYTYRWRHGIILLNGCMEDVMRRMVCGHELGHHMLHRQRAKDITWQEFNLFNIRDRSEYEANAFLAHLTLDTDRVIEAARQGQDVVGMAGEMYTNVNVMLIKLQELQSLGYGLRVPMEPDARFFSHIDGKDGGANGADGTV
ncbi:MAG: ImmA/IrrE family metallo-endopeptidase [Clostridia bacterium]|nr:ImmA/IrrE family metallo-endopeptidase [Clostridia bacterium]